MKRDAEISTCAMKRAECIGMLYPELDDKVVVTIMGACAQELYDLGHRENFFYLQHAMGLASSIGLGLALHLPREKVVVLDGDGSVLMNLGTLATLARYRPRNLVHFIFDNGSLLSTGGFDSHTTSGITDLAAMARGAGIEHVAAVDSVMAFGEAAIEAFGREATLSVIVAKVAAVGPNHYGMDLQLPENAFRFKRWIAGRKRRRAISRRHDAAGAHYARGAMSDVLAQLVDELNRGTLKVVDLTQPLGPSTPVIGLPPMFASSPGMTIDVISKYDDQGPAWYWNTIRMGEHTGTHFDAPIHWITGKDLPDNACDTIPVSRVHRACMRDRRHRRRGSRIRISC